MRYLVLATGVAATAAITIYGLSIGMDGVMVSLAFAGIGAMCAIALRVKERRKRKKQ